MEGGGDKRDGKPPQNIVLNASYLSENDASEENHSPEIRTQPQPSAPASMGLSIASLRERFSRASPVQQKRFTAGLIGFPIVVGVLCFVLYMAFWTDYDSRGMENGGEVQIDGQSHDVYEFDMPSRFQDEFPAENGWNMRIRHDFSEYDYRIRSEEDSGTGIDNDGSVWLEFEDAYDGPMYIQVEDDIIRLALSYSAYEPVKISYSYTPDAIFFAFEWTVCLVWPVCAFAAIKWGFASNRPEFAYGVMISGGIATLLILPTLWIIVSRPYPFF